MATTLASLADLKTLLEISGAENDSLLMQCLYSAAASISQYCGAVIVNDDAGHTEDYNGGGEQIFLRRRPVGHYEWVRESAVWDFDGATDLVEGVDFHLDRERGVLTRLPLGATWADGPGTVRINGFDGGYDAPDAWSGYAQITPPHVQRACLLQAAWLWQRRGQLGQSSQSLAGGGGQFVGQTAYELLDEVKSLLVGERRLA